MGAIERSDYQRFTLVDGAITDVGERMRAKLRAIPLPDLCGRTVLDVGCDMGFWSFLAAERGAARVVGLDRSREVKGEPVDLVALNRSANRERCEFYAANIGRQWPVFGVFDVVFMFSVYHHIYAQCGRHDVIWYWLRRQMPNRGVVLWEGPVDGSDPVSATHIPAELLAGYTEAEIFAAAEPYFVVEKVGPALHEPHRSVYRLTARTLYHRAYRGLAVDGAGGATPAWQHAGGRRIEEFHQITGMLVLPGSLNVALTELFDWGQRFYRARILDVAQRGAGLDGEWRPRWVRLYPVRCNGVHAFVFRFEGERYDGNFVELVSSARLRDYIDDPVEIVSC